MNDSEGLIPDAVPQFSRGQRAAAGEEGLTEE